MSKLVPQLKLGEDYTIDENRKLLHRLKPACQKWKNA